MTRQDKQYRFSPTRRKSRVVFGLLTDGLSARIVTASMQKTAAQAGVELAIYDSYRDPRAALQNAHKTVSNVSTRAWAFQYRLCIPPLGAIHFGINNYQPGI